MRVSEEFLQIIDAEKAEYRRQHGRAISAEDILRAALKRSKQLPAEDVSEKAIKELRDTQSRLELALFAVRGALEAMEG